MKVLKLSLVVLLALLQQSFSQSFLAALGKGASGIQHVISRELVDVVNPVAQVVIKVASSQCDLVKTILGLDYNHTDGDRAPDVDDLPLVYTTKDIQVTFPLRAAKTELPRILGADPASIKIKLFMHGFTDNPSKGNFKAVNDAYRSMGVNVLALDASSLIAYCYLCSSTNVRHIGNGLGEALVQTGLLPENIHLVGHSLGAHIAGFAAKRYEELTEKKVARVTGLDPAGPCFAEVDVNLRLKSTDAVFVDAIHTNAGVFGITESVGHVDFWPNGGSVQPYCPTVTCSHSFVIPLFVASILDPTSFPAVRCNSYDDFTQGKSETNVVNFMGEGAVSSNLGNFCLQTNGESPLTKGTEGTTYVNNNGLVKTIETPIFGILRG